MAENESGAERNLDPTEKRIREAREKGQVLRSRELTSAAVTIAAASAVMMSGKSAGTQLAGIFRDSFSLSQQSFEDPASMTVAFSHALVAGFGAIAPVLGASAVAAIAAPMALGGFVFSPGALVPDFTKLDPVAGFGRMFGGRGLVELGKALLKVVVVGALAAIIVHNMMGEMLTLSMLPTETSIGHGGMLAVRALLTMSLGLLVIAAVDAPYQWWSYHQQLKMSREELKEEFKESDGRPEVKAKIRQLRQRYSKRRMMRAVPTADVVVTNPTHYAVALKYEPTRSRAPRVVAKGRDLVALEIRRLAAEHGVPVFEAPPLARALYGTTDLDREIPQGLYVAVAQVLSYVFQTKSMTAHRAARVRRPAPVVGEEFAKYADEPTTDGEAP